MTQLAPNDLDVLMDKDPLTLTKDDITDIIAYHRRLRGQIEAGERPKKEKVEGPKIDLGKIGLAPAPAPVVRRRL